jgi:hypothetical protein
MVVAGKFETQISQKLNGQDELNIIATTIILEIFYEFCQIIRMMLESSTEKDIGSKKIKCT